MGEAARLGLAEAIFFLATVGSHGVMALKSCALKSMTQDHCSYSTTGQTQARGNDRNFADTRTFRAHEGEYPEVVGRSAPQLPLDGMKRLKASRRFMVRLERRERELDRQRDGRHMPERH